MITIAQVKAECKKVGIRCRYDSEVKEFKVGNTEASAYFTNDREDAIDTAKAMAFLSKRDEEAK